MNYHVHFDPTPDGFTSLRDEVRRLLKASVPDES